MARSSLVLSAILLLLPCAGAQAGIRLVRVPDRVVLPARPGENLMLEVAVTGSPSAVWLARDGKQAERVPLAAAGGGSYQGNLADPSVHELLPETFAAGSLHVCARFGERVLESAPIGWVRADPPVSAVQCLVVGGDGTVREASPRGRQWFDPAVAKRIEVHGVQRSRADVRARIGRETIPLVWEDERRQFVLELDAGLRERMRDAPEFVVEVRIGKRSTLFRQRLVPDRLSPCPGPAFLVRQRRWADVPGSGDWLEVFVGDVTGGQVRMKVVDAEGRIVVAPRLVAEREFVEFALAEGRYALRIDKMVNKLIGDDHVVLAVVPREQVEPDRIAQLIRRVEAAEDIVFVREGIDHGAPAAALLMRSRLAAHKGERPSPAQFVEMCSESSRSGMAYRVRRKDGTEISAREWLTSLLAAIEKGENQ